MNNSYAVRYKKSKSTPNTVFLHAYVTEERDMPHSHQHTSNVPWKHMHRTECSDGPDASYSPLKVNQ